MLKKIPDTYIIVFFLIIVAAILTWFVQGGSYSFSEDGRALYQTVENAPQTWQIFTAFQKGFAEKASIIVFVLIIGGFFWIINSTKAIDAGIHLLLNKISKPGKNAGISPKLVSQGIVVLVMIVFSMFGAIFGMSEETIAFIGIIIPLAISLGFDSITGVSMVFVGAALGFAGAILNPFTIGIAQGIAGLPLFSGLEYRFFCWIVINLTGISYVIWYSGRIYSNPEKSPVYSDDKTWRTSSEQIVISKHPPTLKSWSYFIFSLLIALLFAVKHPVTNLKIGGSSTAFPALPLMVILYGIVGFITMRKSLQYYVLSMLFIIILYLIIGVMGFDWYIDEISALFLAGGIFIGLIMYKKGGDITKLFIAGARDIMNAAIVIGLAGGIIVILEEGNIIDTLLYKASGLMADMGEVSTTGMMYLIQNGINVFIPSGSAQAALTIPVMAPLADLVHLSRQTIVLIFQFGDGFTNMITPTSPVLMGVLGVSRIPYIKWAKWVAPLIIILILLGFMLIIPTVLLTIKGF